MTITIRRALPSDQAAAARIIRESLSRYGLSLELEGRDADVTLFGSRPASDHEDLVAEVLGRVVGLVSLGPHGDPGVGWISKLFVSPDARRLGAGRALLTSAHAAARDRGWWRLGLRTRRIFREALALYASEEYVADEATHEGDLVLWRG